MIKEDGPRKKSRKPKETPTPLPGTDTDGSEPIPPVQHLMLGGQLKGPEGAPARAVGQFTAKVAVQGHAALAAEKLQLVLDKLASLC